MKVLDILNGSFISLVCEPVPAEKITNKLKLSGSKGNILLDKSKKDFFVSFSKPCFSQSTTMFINTTQGFIDHIGNVTDAEFV